MSNVTYDIMWREGIMELLDQLESENPDDSVLAPKDLAEWTCIYIKYLQIYRKLEAAYDQMLHPQKRSDMRTALEACMGRMLEVRHYLVELNHGLDFVHLDDILVDLKLSPEVVEIPIPRYFLEERAQEIQDRDKYLEALLEKFELPKASLEDDKSVEATREELQRIEDGKHAAEHPATKEETTPMTQDSTLPEETAVEEQQEEMDGEKAAILIQSAIRGMQWRKRIREEARQELIFIGMHPKDIDPKTDPACIESKNLCRRKGIQAVHQCDYEAALVEIKQRVQWMEGQDMRETIQDKINAWFVENRDPETGEYPSFPTEGGSKTILNPPMAESEEPETKEKPSTAGPDSKPGSRSGLSRFIVDMEKAVDSYMEKWQERDEEHNFRQAHDKELVKEELRPVIFEDIRQQVDAEVSVMLENLKQMLEAERTAKGKKSKKGSKGKKGKKGKGDKKGKKKKDPTADRTVESLYSELVSQGIVKKCPTVKMDAYKGMFNFLGATLERAGTIPDPSMAQIRQILTEYCILPLGSSYIHSQVPHVKTVLLYGHASTGKSMLSHAISTAVGATFFDLSPKNTDGKYAAKQVSLLIHMVFKVAKIMAPSVIYIDDCEKVFLTDKKKMKEFASVEPYSRIKKDLLKEIKALEPGDRVVVIGNSREPQMCVKKDEKAFMSFWDKHIYVPLPDYSSRRVLWPALFHSHNGKLPSDFDLSTLAHLSDGFASGVQDQVANAILTPERTQCLANQPITIEEIHTCLSLFQPVSQQEEEEMHAWTERLPNRSQETAQGGQKDASDTKKAKSNKKK